MSIFPLHYHVERLDYFGTSDLLRIHYVDERKHSVVGEFLSVFDNSAIV